MKKQFYSKLLFLFALLLTVSTSAWADEKVFEPGDFSGQGTSGSGSAISATLDPITFSCDKGYGTTQFRCYSGSTITISSSSATITDIEFTWSGSYNGGLKSSYTGLSTTEWTQQLSSQARLLTVTVTYTTSAAPQSPLASIELGGEYPTSFAQGSKFSHEGMTVTATYEDASTKNVTDMATFSTPDMNTLGEQTVTVSYTENEVTKTQDYSITVTEYDQPTEFDIALNNDLFGTDYNGQATGITDDKPLEGSQDNVTVTYAGSGNHYVNNSQIRFYPSNKLTFEAPSGYTIKEIVFSAGSTWTITITADSGEYTDGSKTWVGDASSVVFTGSGNSGHCQMTKAAITLASEDESDTRILTTTTIDGTGITNNNRFKGTAAGQLVATVSTEENVVIEGAAIEWSGNNDAVATIAADGTVTLVAAGEVTFTATYAGDDNHKGSTETYNMTVIDKDITVAGATAENPYTVAQARAAIDTNEGLTDVYAKGIVSKIVTAYDSGWGNITFDISVDGTSTSEQLRAYRCESSNEASVIDIQVGDEVVISGDLTLFKNTTYEFTQGNKLVSRKPLVNPTIITAYANATWVAPANVKVSEDVKVYTVEYIAGKSKVYKHEVEDNVVPANAAVLLTSNSKGEATTVEVAVEVTDEPADKYNALVNHLQPSYGTKKGGTTIYCLADGEEGLGFYPVSDEICVPAGKAYLDTSLVGGESLAPSYLWFNDDTTGIDSLTTDTAAGNESGEIYSLTGQRVGKNYRGIVIMNGRKVLKK